MDVNTWHVFGRQRGHSFSNTEWAYIFARKVFRWRLVALWWTVAAVAIVPLLQCDTSVLCTVEIPEHPPLDARD